MAKVLIISYYWPPSGGSGVQRWMYFAKYMEENGIQPIVLTVDADKAAYPAYDYSLLDQVTHVKTFRTQPGFNLLGMYSFLKSGKAKKIVPVGDIGGKKKSWLDKFSAYVRANFFIPDARLGWNKKAIPVAKKIIREEKVDWVITTGPPHSTHLIGLELKKEVEFHWLADFRDPWHDIYYNKLFKRTKRADAKDLQLELRVLKTADTVLTVGPSMKELLVSKHKGLDEKCFFIYNGYDEKAFESLRKSLSKTFTIAHIGVWTLQQAHQEIIEALQEICTTELKTKINFVIAGNVDETILKRLRDIPNLHVDYKGKLNHKDALQEMLNADVLLNCLALVENSKLLISGKLMEYIATGNPIALVGNKDGDAANLLSGINNSIVISPGEVNKLKEYLIKQIKDYPHQETIVSTITRFSRTETTKELVNLLNLRKKIKS